MNINNRTTQKLSSMVKVRSTFTSTARGRLSYLVTQYVSINHLGLPGQARQLSRVIEPAPKTAATQPTMPKGKSEHVNGGDRLWLRTVTR